MSQNKKKKLSLLFCFSFKAKLITVRVLVHDDFLGNDVDNKCVGRSHIKAPWFSNDPDTSVDGEILVQGQVDDSRDLGSRANKLSITEAGGSGLSFKQTTKAKRPLQTGVRHHLNQGSLLLCPADPC